MHAAFSLCDCVTCYSFALADSMGSSIPDLVTSPVPAASNNRTVRKTTLAKPKQKYKCKECCSEYATMKSLKRHEAVHEQAEYR